MSTAERARLGAIAADLQAGTTRAAALERILAGQPQVAVTVDDVAAAPAWLGLAIDDRRRLARRAALAALGPALANSIDGGWLRGLAAVAGSEDLDRGMAIGEHLPELLPAFRGDELDSRADALLRAAAPAALQDRVAPAAPGPRIDPAAAIDLLAAAA